MEFIKLLKVRIKDDIRHVLYLLPIQKNKVVFLNFDGKGYGDNPKYIAEEIIRQKLPWKMVWLTRDAREIPSFIKPVNIDGLNAFYELSTAKCIISNCKHNIPFQYITKKKKKQYYLQTWHGDFALKFIEKEIEDTFSQGYIAASKADSAVTDAILSGNQSFSIILRDSFWLPEQCQILEYGVPRNDLYFRDDKLKDELKQRFGFSKDDKILLYAPTFRDDYDVRYYNLDFERLRSSLPNTRGSGWKIIVRLHPSIQSKARLFSFNQYVVDGSTVSDQQELCMISDYLITDYSSIMGDFLLMRKPVFLYVADLDNYANKTAGRGLREIFYHLPFSFSRNQEELETQIREFNELEYREKVNAFMPVFYRTFDDGHASERVVNHLRGILE